jgi:hypothetical protein
MANRSRVRWRVCLLAPGLAALMALFGLSATVSAATLTGATTRTASATTWAPATDTPVADSSGSPQVIVPPPPSGCGWTYWSGSAQSVSTLLAGISNATAHVNVCYTANATYPISLQCTGAGYCVVLQGPEWFGSGTATAEAYVEIEEISFSGNVSSTIACHVTFHTSQTSNWISEGCT